LNENLNRRESSQNSIHFSYSNQIILRFALLVALLLLGLPIFSCTTGDNTLSGFVQSGDQPIDLSTNIGADVEI